MSHKPTDEQLAILDATTKTPSNLILNALAGCGKTSTLLMLERVARAKPILYLVFNAKNSKDAEYKPKADAEEAARRMSSTTTVRTFNSMGHRIWAQACGKDLKLDKDKTREILREMIKTAPKSAQGAMWEVYWDVLSGVAMAKSQGYIPDHRYENIARICTREEFHDTLDQVPDDLTASLIDAVLTKSIKTAYEGWIDFNDQIYMPGMFGGSFPQFPLVMVDEAQDLNPVNHRMLHKLVKHRIIAVGDPNQSIYGFRGAAYSGMSKLQAHFKMAPLDLSVSFRCPRAIVEAARWRVPHFKWIKKGGHVETLTELQAESIPDNSTFLCRNNAPLFRLAMRLLSAGKSVSVAGSDIGPKLVGIMRRFGEDSLSKQQVLSTIAEWQADKEAKESKTAKDLADCMRVFASQGANLGQAIAYAEHLFKQDGAIRLSTGHKAKGLEWEEVYHLDPWLCREDEQDQNLRYVIQTRSMNRYFEINTPEIRWEKCAA